MSGGAYDYVCHSYDLDDIRGRLAGLRRLNARLGELPERQFPGATAAHAESLRLEQLLDRWEREAEVRCRLLHDVWRAIEWWDSCDSGEDYPRRELAKFVEGIHTHEWVEVMAANGAEPVRWMCTSCPATSDKRPA